MSDSKLKYLKVLKTQYNSGQITKYRYNRELRCVRNQKSRFDYLIDFLNSISQKLKPVC